MESQEVGPVFVAGDINASVAKIQSLMQAVQTGKLIDVGARASIYGGRDNQETCKAKPTSKGTRRDYIFANQQGIDIVDPQNGQRANCL